MDLLKAIWTVIHLKINVITRLLKGKKGLFNMLYTSTYTAYGRVKIVCSKGFCVQETIHLCWSMQGFSETMSSTGVLMKYTDGQSDLSNQSVSFLIGVMSPFITSEFCAFVGLRPPSPIYEPPEFDRGARCLNFWVIWAWELLLSCLVSHISFASSLAQLFQTNHESEPVQ